MHSVRHNRHRNVVIEYARSESSVSYLREINSVVELLSDNIPSFVREFSGYTELGGLPYDPRAAARRFLDNKHVTIAPAALTALAAILSCEPGPDVPWTLFDLETMRVMGHYEQYVDVKRLTSLLPFPTFLLEKASDLETLSGAQMLQMQNGLDPSNPAGAMPSGTKRKAFLKELYIMATSAPASAPATKKVATEGKTARAPKTDGPIFRVKALYDKLEADLRAGKKTRKDAINAAVAANINVATATTQYGQWAKAKNIQTVRAKADPKPPKPPKEPAAKKAPATKKAPAKKAVAKKVPAKKAAA